MNTTYVKCHCHLCGDSIEFPLAAADTWATCPHCKEETLLVRPPASDLTTCNNCGQTMSKDAATCPRCGEETLFNRRATQAASPPNSNLTACSDCGQSISIRAASCPHCGAPTAAAVPTPAGAPSVRVSQQNESSPVGIAFKGTFGVVLALILLAIIGSIISFALNN